MLVSRSWLATMTTSWIFLRKGATAKLRRIWAGKSECSVWTDRCLETCSLRQHEATGTWSWGRKAPQPTHWRSRITTTRYTRRLQTIWIKPSTSSSEKMSWLMAEFLLESTLSWNESVKKRQTTSTFRSKLCLSKSSRSSLREKMKSRREEQTIKSSIRFSPKAKKLKISHESKWVNRTQISQFQ